MKNRLFRAAACVTLATGLSLLALPGAALAQTTDQPVAVATAPASEDSLQAKVAALLAASDLSQDLKDRITAVAQAMPADFDTKAQEARERFGFGGTTYDDILRGAIDGGPYECGPTPLTKWVNAEVGKANPINLLLSLFGGLDLATYDALVFGRESQANTFGDDGTYTEPLTVEMKKLQEFWDFDGTDIELIPMHGEDTYADVDRMAAVYEVAYGIPAELSQPIAALVKLLVDSDPGLDHGNNALFSFNAFSYVPTTQDEEELGISKRIIMGDGILQGQREIGLSDKVAPRAVLAHEYGHQTQHAKDLFGDATGPEATRRTELMADAFATYFMVHSRGAALNAERTLVDQETFFNVGDCSYTSNGHHGTPNQRARSAAWAAWVVAAAPDQGHKIPGAEFGAKFDVKLPELVAPDAQN